MTRRRLLHLGAAAALAQPKPAPLNFVVILIDDMGWADLACQGSKFYETPNIDRLAASGVRFTNGYAACPVCSPSRAAIMTGRFPARTGITNYLPGSHPLPHSKMIGPMCKQYLDPSEITIAEALAQGGYVSGHFGKWHLGPSREYWPEAQGFSVNVGGSASGMPKSFFWPQWGDNPPIAGKQEGEYLTDRLTDEAIAFVAANRERPFFLYLPHYTVHVPIEAKDDLVRRFRGKVRPGAAQNDPVYAAMIASLDENVGRLMTALEHSHVLDRTVVVFTSDNGGLSAPEWKLKPVTSNAPLREGKGHVYEGGIRVPFIVKWPGVKPRIDHTPVCGIDLLPTFCEAAAVKPASSIDGVSLMPLITKRRTLAPRDLFWHYPHYSNQQGKPGGAIRSGDWKLVEMYEDGGVELYNLKADIGEQSNLAARMPARAHQMHARLKAWRNSIPGIQMPRPNPNYNPEKAGFGYWWQTGALPGKP